MKIDWTARGNSLSDSLKARVEQHLSKLERRLKGHTEASVIITEEGDLQGTSRKSFEVVLRNRLGTFTASDSGHELTDIANSVLARIEVQIQKARDKVVDSRRRADEQPWPAEPASD